ncbi:MAG: GTP cyclohydrolase I FolE [Ruminococcus sp.]|nr:GTP cyclohydrolase I FolE [Ruminococcus sp.]MBQ8435367.1 GTP cyclohydrolase I FolE [Oscillospiraceae bacterium]
MIDKEAIKECVRGIIMAIGDDPDREGLAETPQRVANMYEEMFEGMNYTNGDIANMFSKTFDCQSNGGDMVIVRDIDIFSHCEHHLALMYDMKVSVAYIPEGKVLGLSKIARIAEMAAKRLQLQERIGADIAEIISIAAGTQNVAVYIEGKHACMTARGIKSNNSLTRTTTLRGNFKTDVNLQNRLMLMLK